MVLYLGDVGGGRPVDVHNVDAEIRALLFDLLVQSFLTGKERKKKKKKKKKRNEEEEEEEEEEVEEEE
jgi:hypothetical protein